MTDCDVPVLGKVGSWWAFISSIFSFVTFGFRISLSSSRLYWCNAFFSDLCNKNSWRGQNNGRGAFSFSPNVFVDVWTPFVMGFIGVFLHLKSDSYKIKKLVENWVFFFIYHFVMSLFAQMGYANGVGIILGSLSLVGNLIQFLCIFLVKDPPGLELEAKCNIKAQSDSKGADIMAKVANWAGFVASCLVITVGVGRVIFSEASLAWCNNFVQDLCNYGTFRNRLFTFAPDAFADIWTPLIMGIVGVFFHFKNSPLKVKIFCKDWARFTAYHLVMMLFGCLGYVNGWGIIMACFVGVATIMAFVAFFLVKEEPGLELEVGWNMSLKGSGANVNKSGNAN